MTDWVSYSLTDLLPFSRATYERLYALHNARSGPAPVVGIAVGVVALLLLLLQRSGTRSGTGRGSGHGIGHGIGPRRLPLAAFGLCWLWVGWAFFITTLAPLLWAAPLFALAFAGQAGLLLAIAALPWCEANGQPDRRADQDAAGPPADREMPARQRLVALALLASAILAPPLLGLITAADPTALALFGTAPDPTAFATIALAATLPRRHALLLLPIPLTWCLISALMLWGLDSALWPFPAIGALLGLGLALHFSGAPRHRQSAD